MRLFYAVLIPQDIVDRVREVQERFRAQIADSGVKWAKPETFHFTIKFLGDTPPEKIEKALLAGQAVKEGRNPFELRLGGAGGFPSSQRPSTLWVGVKEGSKDLAEIALQLDELLVKYGYQKERRPLVPHVTLARIKSYAGEAESARALQSIRAGELGGFTVDRFALMRSQLKPSGSEYTVVEEFVFGKAAGRDGD
jgi:2'-5' RNA ligase